MINMIFDYMVTEFTTVLSAKFNKCHCVLADHYRNLYVCTLLHFY